MPEETAAEQDRSDRFTKLVGGLLAVLSLLLVGFQLYTAGVAPLQPMAQRAVHVGLGLAIAYLGLAVARPTGGTVRRALDCVAGAFCVIAAAYIVLQETRLTTSFGVIAQTHEVVLAAALTVLVLEAARRTTGVALPILAIVMVGYTLFGSAIPGYWGHTGFSVTYLIEHLYLGTEGIWGTVTGLSAKLIAIFIIFGSMLLATGAARTFMDVALLAAGRFPGGGAKVATLSSALFGMLNGAAVANVATTGNLTIPAMKRLGYRPTFAGAVEATASSGGQITPPIMGAGAFVMAELLGIPYLDVVYAAIVPAFLFFVCVWISIDIEARREGMRSFAPEDMPVPREVFAFRNIGPVVLTLLVTLGAMFSGRTPVLAAFYGICTNVLLYFAVGPYDLNSLRDKVMALFSGAKTGTQSITGILALLVTAQITLSLVSLTGIGIKLSAGIIGVGDGAGLLPGVLLAMVVALVLGMGMPTTAAYLLAAAVAAPALISLGLEPLIAHFFVFYSALLSALTPPVCTAVFTAAMIARTHWWPICLQSMRLAVMKYLLPLMFVFRPSVLLEGTWQVIAWSVVMGVVASWLVAVGFGRYFRGRLALPWAPVLVLAGGGVIADTLYTDALAVAVAGGFIVLRMITTAGRVEPVRVAGAPAGDGGDGMESGER